MSFTAVVCCTENTPLACGVLDACVPSLLSIMARIRFALLTLVLLTGYSAWAQEYQLPDAPLHHKFFDRQNTTAFAVLGGLIAVDAVTTQHMTNSGRAREENPLWRPLVRQGWQGEMAASALGFGAAVSIAYTFHKTGHHKMERVANWFVVSMEGANDAHGLYLATRH